MIHSILQVSLVIYLHAVGSCLGESDITTVSCESAARRLGQPLDGWKVVMRRSQGKVNEHCVREAVDLQCAPSGTQFYHPETRVAECCPVAGSITWQDEGAKLGFCCASGHEWTGEVLTGEGGCCPTGMLMVDGSCVNKLEEEPMVEGGGCGCSSKHTSPSAPSSSSSIEYSHVASGETEPELGSTQVPGDSMSVNADLGIHYGRCYRLSLRDGRQVGSNRENAIYTPRGLFPNIPFRVCRSTSNCSEGQTGIVSSQSRFFLQDQVGRHNDPTGTMGWVAGNKRGALKMMFTVNNEKAMGFTGRRSEACDEGASCSLKLSGLPLELLFSETTCMTFEEPESTYNLHRSSDEL